MMTKKQLSLLRESARSMVAATCFLSGKSEGNTFEEIDMLFSSLDGEIDKMPADFEVWRKCMVKLFDKCKRCLLTAK